jgi:hypothetical protein
MQLAAARLCAASRARRTWLGLVALTLLVGFVGAVVLTAAAGARRTDSAFDRMKDETHAAVLRIFGHGISDADVATLRALPGVQGIGLARQFTAEVDGQFISLGGPLDDKVGRTIERPRLLEGRRPHQDRVDEIALPERLAQLAHLRVGDTLTISSYSPADVVQLETNGQGDPTGPKVRLRVVGITRSASDLSIEGAEGGLLFATRAFTRRYRDEIGSFAPRVLVIRVSDANDEARVVRTARALFGGDGASGEFQVQPTSEVEGGVQDSIGVLTTGLLVFALVAGLAGLVVLAIALRRTAEGFSEDLPVLRALGVSRSSRVAAVVLTIVPAALVGAALAVVVAFAASPLMPIGLAREAEPDPGLSFDAVALGLGFAAVLLVVVALGVWSAHRVVAQSADGDERSPGSSRLARRAVSAGLGPSVTVGLATTLEPGHGARAVPVRTAVVAGVVAVVGLVAVTVVGTSIHDLPQRPRAYGFNWDANTSDGRLPRHRDAGPCTGLRTSLVDDHAIVGASEVCSVTGEVDGHAVTVFGFAPLRGHVGPTVLDGRAPRTADEAALGTATLAAVHAEIGDTVRIAGPDHTHRFRVVGRVALPSFRGTSDIQAIADGATLTGRGVASITSDDSTPPVVVLRWRRGADIRAAEARIRHRPHQVAPVFGPRIPLEVDRLEQVDTLPWLLGAFLAVIGTLGVAYALVTGVRRRARELATLKALGFRRGQVASAVAVQATLLAAAAVIVGVPLGVVVGRVVWHRIADQAGMLADTAVPAIAVVGIAVATVVVANLVAAIPARRAARLRPAVVLRSE